MRISDWSSDVCSSDLGVAIYLLLGLARSMGMRLLNRTDPLGLMPVIGRAIAKTNQFFMIMVAAELVAALANPPVLLVQIIHFLFTIRSEEHTYELQYLMRISYDLFCLKKQYHNT